MPHAPKPADEIPIDYADHTLEVDIRWTSADTAVVQQRNAENFAGNDDPTVVLDLTTTQVHKLVGGK
jgi:hypothetical protein